MDYRETNFVLWTIAMNKPVDTMETDNSPNKPRSQDRNSLLLKAVLRFPSSGSQGEVRVRNLSSGGMMAEAPIQASRGEAVEINLKNLGWVTGKVAWVAESRCGIAFDYPIDPKAARQQIGANVIDETMPLYLRRLNNQAAVRRAPLRRI
ncbi:MAG TPA: PilZ domain-containing protein [Sphingorhabdus sp.]|nr:PilZ domain-containing protein [Sphingorhabdus sp.]